MLTEQNTPLPLVRQWSNLIPHCWESLDELTAKIRATQPSNMAAEAELYAAMSIVQAHVANGSLPVEIVHASFELFCCALWRHSKVVYSFDNTLAAELVQQADEWDDSDNLPIDVLLHPPYRCAFISCPGVITRRLSVSSRLSCEIWIKEHLSFTFVWYTKLSVP